MPEGRMIRRKIADSERLNRLPVEARLLYDRLILFVDKEARHHANPRLLLRRFFPLDNYSDKDMEEWLQGLYAAKKNGKGLIELYEIDGLKFLWLPGFEGEQSKSWVKFTKEKEAESSIPEPSAITKGKKKPDIKTDTKLKDMVDLFEKTGWRQKFLWIWSNKGVKIGSVKAAISPILSKLTPTADGRIVLMFVSG